MRVISLVFILITYTILQGMVLSELHDESAVNFPEFDLPSVAFRELGDCESLAGCVRFIGFALYNIGAGIVNLVLLLFGLARFVVELFALLITLVVDGVPGAPWYVNLIVRTPMLATVSMLMYMLIRSGRNDA